MGKVKLSKAQVVIIESMQISGKPLTDLDIEMSMLESTANALCNKGIIYQDGKNFYLTEIGKTIEIND